MKKSILLGLILSLLIVLPVFAQDPIKIGVYAPLSGDSAMVGQTLVEGVQLATKQINEAGGIDGRPIELIIEDDEQSPKVAVSAVNKLVYKDKVIGVIGTVNSSCTLASMEVTWEAEVPHITPIASNPTITVDRPDSSLRRASSRCNYSLCGRRFRS
jgi:branched-chain amino acid transport system substrate-binding protein